MKQKILIKALDKKTYEIEGKLVETTPTSKAPGWFTSYMSEFNKQLNHRLDNIENDIKDLKNDVKAIKNTPTMKKELNK